VDHLRRFDGDVEEVRVRRQRVEPDLPEPGGQALAFREDGTDVRGRGEARERQRGGERRKRSRMLALVELRGDFPSGERVTSRMRSSAPAPSTMFSGETPA
jgi:hypothetical protein